MNELITETPQQKGARIRWELKTPHGAGRNPFLRAIEAAKQNSCVKKRKLPFTLTYKDIKILYKNQKGKCAFTGIPLVLKRGFPQSLSLDRLDNSLGYTLENVRLVCRQINLMKASLSDEEFIEWCQAVTVART